VNLVMWPDSASEFLTLIKVMVDSNS